MKLEIKEGEKHNMLTFIKEIPPHKSGGGRRVYCKCDCGEYTDLCLYNFKSGKTKSCGCEARKVATHHGFVGTRFYGIWQAMKNRVMGIGKYNKKYYGGGKLEGGWEKFINFKDDMYESYIEHSNIYGESNTSLDRINNNGYYYKDNLRWATRGVQQRNTSKNIIFKSNGKVQCLKDWCEELGLNYKSIHYYYKYRGKQLQDLLKIDGELLPNQ